MDPKIAELKEKIDKLEKEIKGARKNTKAVKKTKFIPLKMGSAALGYLYDRFLMFKLFITL